MRVIANAFGGWSSVQTTLSQLDGLPRAQPKLDLPVFPIPTIPGHTTLAFPLNRAPKWNIKPGWADAGAAFGQQKCLSLYGNWSCRWLLWPCLKLPPKRGESQSPLSTSFFQRKNKEINRAGQFFPLLSIIFNLFNGLRGGYRQRLQVKVVNHCHVRVEPKGLQQLWGLRVDQMLQFNRITISIWTSIWIYLKLKYQRQRLRDGVRVN